MTRFDALLWDVDGVLAETERDGHRVAFNQAFEAGGMPWRWDEARYGELLRITGGRERLLVDMATRADAPPHARDRAALARALHARKNAFYAQRIAAGAVALRPGVPELMQECLARGVRMGIASTTSRMNVEALLRHHLGAAWQGLFATIVCGEDVQRKKPAPEVYVRALRQLGGGPRRVVAIEDAPAGVAAARAAEVPVLVTRSAYFGAAAIEGAIAIGPGLHERQGWQPALPRDGRSSPRVGLDDIDAWYGRAQAVSQAA